ncbi:MAG: hypothetical protein QXE31_02085 [Candidatus Woesearchaeota archaeon]
MAKIKCPNCNCHNNYSRLSFLFKKKILCENCKSEILIKRKFPFFLVFFIIISILFFIFLNLEVNYGIDYINIPYYVIREVNKSIPYEKTICENRSFRFSTFGGNVITIGNNVYPNLQITNLENQWGLFKVNFSYINESKFPYGVYGGENLKKAFEEKKISVNDADFYSENYDIVIGPMETILVDKPTQKIDKNTNYWAIGTIIEPKIEECRKKTEYIFVKENKTFMETRKEERIIKKKIYEIILDYLKNFSLKNLWDLVVIFLLFFIIIFLFIKIRDRLNLNYLKKRINEQKNNEKNINLKKEKNLSPKS